MSATDYDLVPPVNADLSGTSMPTAEIDFAPEPVAYLTEQQLCERAAVLAVRAVFPATWRRREIRYELARIAASR